MGGYISEDAWEKGRKKSVGLIKSAKVASVLKVRELSANEF